MLHLIYPCAKCICSGCQSLWLVSPTCTHLSWPCHELHSGLCIPLAPTCPGLDISFPLDLVWPSHCLCCSAWPGHHGCAAADRREVLAQRGTVPCISMHVGCSGLQSCSCMHFCVACTALSLTFQCCLVTALALILQCCLAQPLPGSCLLPGQDQAVFGWET